MTAVETSLKAERQHNDAIMKQLADAQVEIGELQRNLEDADRRNNLLQDSLQRFLSYLKLITQCDIILNNQYWHVSSQKENTGICQYSTQSAVKFHASS